MNIKEKLKQFINVTDDDYVENEEREFDDQFDYQPSAPSAPAPQSSAVHARTDKASNSNVVNISSSKNNAQGKPHVVFQKISSFEEVKEVADILIDKRIVILNLESCPNDASQRIIDFLFGVAYANHGDFKKVAGRAYIITPYNIPVTGELLDEINGEASVDME